MRTNHVNTPGHGVGSGGLGWLTWCARGLEPEIDLTGPPTDPGISRLHAVLLAEPDGSWTILDPGSENGTLVNGREITAGVRLPLRDGDRIHLGAWTLITIQAG